jgi:hypothetical protein
VAAIPPFISGLLIVSAPVPQRTVRLSQTKDIIILFIGFPILER